MKYKIILRYLLLKIQNNEILIGDRLLSKRQLSYKFNCNRHTIENVYANLISSNLIKYKEGVGYFLINDFDTLIGFETISRFSIKKNTKISEKKLPLKLLKNIGEDEKLIKQMSQTFFLNDIIIGKTFAFIQKKHSEIIKINFKSIFKLFAMHGIVVNKIKRNLSFINNKDGKLDIKDNSIYILSLVLFDEDNKKICQIYNICSASILQLKSNFFMNL